MVSSGDGGWIHLAPHVAEFLSARGFFVIFDHLIRLFLERCDDFGGIPVFYQVSSEHLHRVEREHGTFRVIPPCEVPCVMNQLQSVSDEWLAHRAAAGKGFSLGFFTPDYVARFL